MTHDIYLLSITALAIVVLVILIAVVRMNSFIALTLVALATGLAAICYPGEEPVQSAPPSAAAGKGNAASNANPPAAPGNSAPARA